MKYYDHSPKCHKDLQVISTPIWCAYCQLQGKLSDVWCMAPRVTGLYQDHLLIAIWEKYENCTSCIDLTVQQELKIKSIMVLLFEAHKGNLL